MSKTLGNLIKSDLDNEKTAMAKQCCDFSSLILNQENGIGIVTSFLHGCAGDNTGKDKKLNSCLHAIEQIIYAKNNNVVTPFSLERNIIMYLISKSKLASMIFGKALKAIRR